MRSDRQFSERLRYDLLFQWFLDINPDELGALFDASTFSKNQERLLGHATADVFFAQVVELARAGGWLSNEHFSVDGTLIEAWASLKSFRPKDEPPQGPGAGNGWEDFHGQKRSNATHQSTSDPEARLLRKGAGKEAKLCFAGHAARENRLRAVRAFRGHACSGRDGKRNRAGPNSGTGGARVRAEQCRRR